MNRRDFLRAAVAAPMAAGIPAWLQPLPAAAGLTLAQLDAAVQKLRDYAIDNGMLVVHPVQWQDVLLYECRGQWYAAYREWRMSRSRGVQVETLREVMERVGRYAASTRKAFTGETGTYSGMTFHMQQWLPPR